MKIQDCTLANIHRLGGTDVYGVRPFRRSKMPEFITIAVVKRMACLITRMEIAPNVETAIGAKWVLACLPALNTHNVLRNTINPFAEKLEELVINYEEYSGVVDETYFGKMIQLAGFTPDRVLFGEPIINVGGGSGLGSPWREVASFISYSMWKQTFTD